ncbi:MAG: MerR family transcriptional regulator [Ardenticatenaceae bacterium]|nr:MerR family transcriptional regulator [Ardenticatenaceae bacterium]
MQLFSIGEIGRMTGLRTSAIRYYEQVGLLPQPKRVNGRRQYTEVVILHLNLIQNGRKNGLTISECQQLVQNQRLDQPPSPHTKTLIDAKITELNRQIAQIERMKNSLKEWQMCRCEALNKCEKTTDNRPQTSENQPSAV